jgi:pyridoxal phosphate enzyme (YggS family)
MSTIPENLQKIRSTLPPHVSLVAISKTKPAEDIMQAYEAGQRIFGENKVQELVNKYELLPKDIQWHLVGHLQTNKVKYIAPFVALIHSVDSLKLLQAINQQGAKCQRKIPVLLQVYIAKEETKFGLDQAELEEICSQISQFNFVSIEGVMGMATNTEDENIVRSEFRNLKNIFLRLQSSYFHQSLEFKHISMGMSGDYIMAIEEGSTMVRVGSSIFGGR